VIRGPPTREKSVLGSLVEITPPAVAVVSAADAKRYLHGVAEDETDADLEALVEAATQYAQTWLSQQLITATWDLVLPGFPAGVIELTPPLQSVTSIKYYDWTDALQTWSDDEYEVDTDHRPGRVRPASYYSYPAAYDRIDAATVKFVCGYGDAATDVPANIVLAVKALVAFVYENRGTAPEKAPPTVERLLSLSGHGAYA